MVAHKKFVYFIITAIAVLTAAATLSVFSSYSAAYADGLSAADLIPVETDSAVSYHFFEDPRSVYADEIGILVACGASVEYVSGGCDITARKGIAADKAYRSMGTDGHSEYLAVLHEGNIAVFYGETETSRLDIADLNEKFIDLAVYGGKIYALTRSYFVTAELNGENAEITNAAAVKLVSDRHTKVDATAFTILNGKVYIAVDSVGVRKQDICVLDGSGRLTVVFGHSENVISLSSRAEGSVLYALTRGELARYTVSAGGGLEKISSVSGSELTAVFAYGDGVYALDSLNALHKFSADLSSDSVMIASGGDTAGFFNMPGGAAAKNSVLYVADTMNGRIAAYGGDIKYFSNGDGFINPIAVAADSAGMLYVAHDYDKISVFRADGSMQSAVRTFTAPGLGMISHIAVDSDKSLYVAASSGLWKAESGGELSKITAKVYRSISLGLGRNKLYALSGDTVDAFGDMGTPYEYCRTDPDALSLAVDLDGRVFILKNDGMTRVDPNNSRTEYTLTSDGKPYVLGGKSGLIMLCSVENAFVKHGDIIIVDTYKHRLFKTDGKTVGARFVDESYKVPPVADDSDQAVAKSEGIIHTALRDTQMFAFPMESQPVMTIPAGRKIIVPYYELEETREYSLVLYDDTENDKLIQGYVYKDCLSAALEYISPPNAVCSVFAEITPIYRWPSRYAKAIKGFAAVEKNRKFGMLDFVDGFCDEYGYYWYRVDIGNGCDGYVPAINVSTVGYDFPMSNILPEYNAEIVSYNGNDYAQTFVLADGKYTASDEFSLKAGTRVEVIGAYDSSEQYTKIKFLDEKSHKTVTCYVRTVHVKYDGVNVVLIVAIIVIIVTVILAAAIIAKTLRSKKKRLETDDRSNIGIK